MKKKKIMNGNGEWGTHVASPTKSWPVPVSLSMIFNLSSETPWDRLNTKLSFHSGSLPLPAFIHNSSKWLDKKWMYDLTCLIQNPRPGINMNYVWSWFDHPCKIDKS